MNTNTVKKTGQLLIILLFTIGMYHFLVALRDNNLIQIKDLYLYRLYYIPTNLMLTVLLICIHRFLKQMSGLREAYKKFPILIAIYPISKVIISIGYLVEPLREFLDKIKDFWSFILITVIVTILIFIKRLR